MCDVLLKNAYSKSGKPEGSMIDVEGTEKVTPMIIDDCQKHPRPHSGRH
jgi:acid stress chaperone HdeA